MKIKKFLRVSGFVLLGVILLVGILAALFYYQNQGKYQVDSEKYAHNVGYIEPSNTIQFNDDFELCGNERLIGYYHSAAPKIYKGTKLEFREFILSNFENKGFTDSGMLNLRFHINCNGQVGNMEINELDNDFEKRSLTEELVDQLIELVSQSMNWEPFAGKDYNYYMYLNFKIEDGNITEIIP
jgi:hypothetical protein